MGFELTEQRASCIPTAIPRSRCLRGLVRACLCATAVLFAGVAALSLLPSPVAVADIDVEERAIQDVVALVEEAPEEQRAVVLEVPAVAQNPELPTGCESLALTNALLSFGFELEKTEIADAWLPRSDVDFVNAFMGDPYSSDGHSCMAPGIALAANAYLAEQRSSLEAFDITGASLEDLLDEVADGNPVIAWCTIDLDDPGIAYRTTRENGRTYRLYANSHCVVVSGFDLDEGTVLVSDSLTGQVAYDLQLFAERYYQVGAQAVVIR